MAIAVAQSADFELGRTIQRTFAVVGKNIPLFALLSLAIGIPLAILDWVGPQFGAFTARLTNPSALLFYAVFGILYLIGYFVLQAGVIQAAVALLMGQTVDSGNALTIGVKYFGRLLLLTLALVAGICGAMLLLVVPGVIVALMWTVALPVCVVEHTNVGESLDRSGELTKGHRWAIFGLVIILALLNMVIGLVLGAVGGVGAALMGVGFAASAWGVGITVLVQMIGGVIGASMYASIYYELRLIKEGVGPEALASVFD